MSLLDEIQEAFRRMRQHWPSRGAEEAASAVVREWEGTMGLRSFAPGLDRACAQLAELLSKHSSTDSRQEKT